MMEPLPDHIERYTLSPGEIDSARAAVLPDIVARVKARLARGERREVVYAPHPLPYVRAQEPPPPLREIAKMSHPAVLTSVPIVPPGLGPEPMVVIDMTASAASRVRQALTQGKRETKAIMEITGASRSVVVAERWLWFKRTGQKMPPRSSVNEHIKACIAAGMTDARAIQAATGATWRNHIHRLLKEQREKAKAPTAPPPA